MIPVLLSVTATDATDGDVKRREALARRIINLESPRTRSSPRRFTSRSASAKPRIGYDTAIGGKPAPELLPPAIPARPIGESFVGPDGLPLTPDRARPAC